MKAAVIGWVALALVAADADARGRGGKRSSSSSVHVDGYYRKDGTYVDSYTRSSPSPAPPTVFTGYTPAVPSSSTLSAGATPAASPASPSNTGRNLLLASAAIGLGFFGWMKFQPRPQPAPPETLEQRVTRLWGRLSDRQQQQIQDFRYAHAHEFFSDNDLKTEIEKILDEVERDVS